MEEKKKYKITVVVLYVMIFILISIVLYQHTVISQSPNYLSPSGWICDEKIETEVDFNEMQIVLTIDITDTNITNYIKGITTVPVYGTGSMEPVMFGGNQLLVLEITNKDLIKLGDIIGFKAENKTIVHRVIEKSYVYYENTYEPVFRTKGDNCTEMDQWIIRPGDIEGVVIGVLY